MAPEQVRSDLGAVDAHSDIYALGVSLYEFLTLRRPFDYKTPDALFHAIVHEEPVSPRVLVPELPKSLEAVVLQAMHKDPKRRYQNAREFAEDLRRVRMMEAVQARPVKKRGPMRRWLERNKALSVAIVAAALAWAITIHHAFSRASPTNGGRSGRWGRRMSPLNPVTTITPSPSTTSTSRWAETATRSCPA
jgi:serine/threonine protein kinase